MQFFLHYLPYSGFRDAHVVVPGWHTAGISNPGIVSFGSGRHPALATHDEQTRYVTVIGSAGFGWQLSNVAIA
ncbi:Uncharacterised protein [Mycobacteroides abscessus subsp. bolletii]|nr:Uncharacterised protein [Mycobacteroides abscessus subsp. bolletii]